MIDRQEFAEELVLRESIRKVIKIVLEKRRKEDKQQLNEEKQLRNIIRNLLIAEATDVSAETPHENTGINVLEDLLNKILTNMETDYKALTTKPEQKKSYRAHIVKGIMNILAPAKAVANVGDKVEAAIAEAALRPLDEEDEDIDITVGDDEDIDITVGDDDEEEGPNLGQEAFIDIEGGAPEEEEEDTFGIEGENETGMNMARRTFKQMGKNILDHYELLADEEDRQTFYDYLITNVKLYFDKWDTQSTPGVEEPTTPEYDAAAAEAEGGEEAPAEGGEEEFELEL